MLIFKKSKKEIVGIMYQFFLNNSIWIILIGAIISAFGTILSSIKTRESSKNTSSKLEKIDSLSSENNKLVVENSKLTVDNQKYNEQIMTLTERIAEISTNSNNFLISKDSYCIISYHNDSDELVFSISNAGKYPLSQVHVSLMCEDKGEIKHDPINKDFSYMTKNAVKQVSRYSISKDSVLRLEATIESNVGYHDQFLRLVYSERRKKWISATVLYDENNKVLYSHVDKYFPMDLIKMDKLPYSSWEKIRDKKY